MRNGQLYFILCKAKKLPINSGDFTSTKKAYILNLTI